MVCTAMARQIKTTSLLLLLELSWYCLYCAEAFTPNRLADFTARRGRSAGEVRDGVSRTHPDISTEAILQVTVDLLRDNPNPNPNIDSTARINALTDLEQELTSNDLIDAFYGKSSREQRSRYEDAIEQINEANEETDTGAEGTLAAAHFDSEQLKAGQQRLINLRELITTDIQNQNYDIAREFAGSMLHTLQDFYSHTNWIEMGQRVPNSVLGKRGHELQNVAPSNMATCSNCMVDNTVLEDPLVFLGTFATLGQAALFYYRCNNNILSDINANRMLTSGYYTGQTNTTGVILKPAGKCSHGGFGDSSSDFPATGGINKDSISLDWSPHADLHDEAAAIAIEASVNILEAIRTAVDDDSKFAAFLNLQQVMASIAYVIDTTGSMGEELPQIQATIPMIRAFLEDYVEGLGGNARVRFILVPFNDPDPGITIITEDIDEFLNAIGNLFPTGGGDCPEPSIGALIRAIRASERGSQVFVYTDADASDRYRVPELLALIRKTGIRINDVLTGSCSSPFDRKRSAEGSQQDTAQYNAEQYLVRLPRQVHVVDDVYTLIAAISGGQVLNVNPFDISELSPLISFSIVQSVVTIFYRTSSISSELYNFTVDESVSQVLILVNGVRIAVTVRTPGGIDSGALGSDVYGVSVQTSETYIAMVNVSDSSLYGEWQLNLTSFGSNNIRITAISDLDFTYTLYRLDRESNFGFVSFEGSPLEGEILVLFIQFQGNFERTEFIIREAVLLTIDGNTIESLNTTDIGDGGYASFFVTPTQPFLLQIIGTNSNGNPISRISPTGVQPIDEEIVLFSFTSLVYSVVELTNAEAEVTVQLEQGNLTTNVQVTVDMVDDGTATVNVDYSNTTCELVFPAGSGPGTTRSCFILILDDVLEEGDETIIIVGSTATTVLPFTTIVVITDNDALFSFTSLEYSVVELANAEAEVTVQLEQRNLTTDVQVTVETVDDGTASTTVDVDYNNTVCQLVFPAGSGPGTTRSCFIPILDDVLEEGDETITIVGSTATAVLPFTTIVVITDNDALCPDPVAPLNGGVTFTGNSASDTANYTCDSGFELIGSALATCGQMDANSAAFSPAAPECRLTRSSNTGRVIGGVVPAVVVFTILVLIIIVAVVLLICKRQHKVYNTVGIESGTVIKNEPAMAKATVTMPHGEDELQKELYVPGPQIEMGKQELKWTPMVFGEGDSLDKEATATPFKTTVL